MAKYRKGKKRNSHNFVMLRFDIMKSEAWRSLSPVARCVWTEIMLRFNGNNNGQIPLSCREAATLCNTSNNTAARAFNDLIDRGFIKIAGHSDFRLKTKTARRWTVTHEGLGNEKTGTNEWRKFKTQCHEKDTQSHEKDTVEVHGM